MELKQLKQQQYQNSKSNKQKQKHHRHDVGSMVSWIRSRCGWNVQRIVRQHTGLVSIGGGSDVGGGVVGGEFVLYGYAF